MQAWAIEKYGDNKQLKLMSLPRPSVATDEVLIQIKAASINPVDFKIRNGEMKAVLKLSFPFILGNDCAGIVAEVGANVRQFKVGDEVYVRPSNESTGTFAEWIAVKESLVALKPKNTSFEEAASLPLIGLTSWQALIVKGGLKKGDRVFIPAGSGGVGTFAIQLAKYLGAHVITNTSGKNIEFVKSLGADEVINYQTHDFSEVISPVDLVFDTMGGETQKKAFSNLKENATLVSIVGPPSLDFAKEHELNFFFQAAIAVIGFPSWLRARIKKAHYTFLLMSGNQEQLKAITALIESGKIKPVIDRVFPFAQTDQALAYVELGRARGKVVVSV